jgi:hypothetical protein
MIKHIICTLLLFSIPALPFEYKPETGHDQGKVDKATFRIVRSICGSKGSQRGDRFVMEDPRMIFHVPEDRKVIVYMELEGPVGNHRVEGFWKSPDGKVASLSDFDYASQDKIFSVYLSLALLESAATGGWTLEIHVDGEYISDINFQIVAGVRTDVPNPAKKPLSPSEVYQRALASTVTIEKLGKKGEVLGTSTGFVAPPALLISAFHAIDGASKLRVAFPDGKRKETDQILAWNRRQGYSVISVDTGQVSALPVAPENSWQIGESAIFLEVTPDGNRVISEAKIIGRNSLPQSGDRPVLSVMPSVRAIGGALLNEYGEIIGIIGGPLYAGDDLGSGLGADSVGAASDLTSRSAIAVPLGIVNTKQTSPSTLESLVQSGEMLLPVSPEVPILYAQLTHRIQKGEGKQWPMDASRQFSRRDGKIGIFVMWNPKEKLKGALNFLVYDLNNKLLGPFGNVKETKVSFQPGRQVSSSWELDVSNMPSAIYRIDVQFSGIPCWRTFFQIKN